MRPSSPRRRTAASAAAGARPHPPRPLPASAAATPATAVRVRARRCRRTPRSAPPRRPTSKRARRRRRGRGGRTGRRRRRRRRAREPRVEFHAAGAPTSAGATARGRAGRPRSRAAPPRRRAGRPRRGRARRPRGSSSSSGSRRRASASARGRAGGRILRGTARRRVPPSAARKNMTTARRHLTGRTGRPPRWRRTCWTSLVWTAAARAHVANQVASLPAVAEDVQRRRVAPTPPAPWRTRRRAPSAPPNADEDGGFPAAVALIKNAVGRKSLRRKPVRFILSRASVPQTLHSVAQRLPIREIPRFRNA